MQHAIEAAYNTLYRNYPGWFYNQDDTIEKAKEAEDETKPVIEPIKKQGDSSKERKSQDSYDIAGSDIRNQVRMSGMYNKKGMKASI